MSGNLIVRPLSAKLTHGTDLFGKMDPLVKVIVGNHVQRTPAMRRGHKNPTWDTELSLRRTNEDLIVFEVWDKDILTKNDLIGAGELPFSKIFSMGGQFKDWIPLVYKNKSAGELLVNIEFIPDQGVNMSDEGSRVRSGGLSNYGQYPGGNSTYPTQGNQSYQPTPIQPTSNYTMPPTILSTSNIQPTQSTYNPQPLSSQYIQPTGQYDSNYGQRSPYMQDSFQRPSINPNNNVQSTMGNVQGNGPDPLSDLERRKEREEGFVPGDTRDFVRSSNVQPGYNSGIMGYQPLPNQQTSLRGETFQPTRYEPTVYGSNRYDNQQVGPNRSGYSTDYQQPITQQPLSDSPSRLGGYSSNYQQPIGQPGQQPFNENFSDKHKHHLFHHESHHQPHPHHDSHNQRQNEQKQPGHLTQDLKNISSRITGMFHKKKASQDENVVERDLMGRNVNNVSNVGYTDPMMPTPYYPMSQSNYQKENIPTRIIESNVQHPYYSTSDRMMPLPEKMGGSYVPTQELVVTQIPGVISNIESRPEEGLGKFVVHQGGTHSQVGSVQSHRIISRVADNPNMTTNDFDREARIALGEVPQTRYNDKK